MNLLDFFYQNQSEILGQTIEHLNITLVSLFFAIILGLSIGITISRLPKTAGFILSVLGVIQTIPSLALLGFMLPVLGIGVIPAIVALFLYALLPIVRNTFTGIKEVDKSVREAGQGMGLSDTQILLKVELPLAIPIIFAGIRTAVVINIGVATLCALIGAGGLGEFIFRGISLSNTNMILAGAIPSALLALLLDGILAIIQKYIQQIIKPVLIITSALMLLVVFNFTTAYFANNQLFKLGSDAEFIVRPDGYKALKKHYGIKVPVESMEFEAGLMYQSLKEDLLDMIAGYSTDGRIEAYNLRVLKDDKHYFPPYYVSPLIRQKTLNKFPELEEVLNQLAGKITETKMRKLNYQVDGQGKFPKEVAKAFLKKEGFKTQVKREGKADIIIGGKKFTEHYILIEIFKNLIENYTDLTVELKSGLGGTNITFNALKNGQIDMYPEYTGTALFAILKTKAEIYKPIIQNKDKVFEYVKTESKKRFDIVWLKSLGFQNNYALMMQSQKAEKLGIQSISDLAKYLNEKYER